MKRIVIKVGTHIITDGDSLSQKRISNLVSFIAKLSSVYEVIVVSSGAVGAGYTKVPLDKSKTEHKQALAAIGQPYLINSYVNEFEKFGLQIAQVLLGYSELDSRKSTRHCQNAINTLLKNGVIPIINENDVTSIDELVFGDNDQLSAHITHYLDADLLVLLSDIDGFYDKDPKVNEDAKIIKNVYSISEDDLNSSNEAGSKFGTGGIYTKLKAAKFLLENNKKTFLTSGFDLRYAEDFLIRKEHTRGTLFENVNN